MSPEPNPEHVESHLRARFDTVPSFTVGAEEELLLVDQATCEPLPAVELVLELFRGDDRLVAELRASQV